MSDISSRNKFLAVFIAAIMLVGFTAAFAGTAAASNFDEGEPGNLNVGLDETEVDFAENGAIEVPEAAADDGDLFIDLQPLEDRGIDLDGVSVTTNDANNNDNIEFATINDGEIQIRFTDDPSADIELNEVQLNNLDTNGVEAETDVEFDLRAIEDDGSQVFSGTPTVDLVSIENVDQGEFYEDIATAVSTAEVEDGDRVEVSAGEFEESDINIDEANVELVGIDGVEETFIVEDTTATTELIEVVDGSNDVSVSGFNVTVTAGVDSAITVDAGAADISDNEFNTEGDINQFIDINSEDDVVISQNDFDGEDGSDADGIIVNGENADINGNDLTNLDNAVDLSSATSESVIDNVFAVNNIHAVDPNDGDAVFDNNEFDQYAIIIDEDAETIRSDLAGQLNELTGEDLTSDDTLEILGDEHDAVGGVFDINNDGDTVGDGETAEDITITSPEGHSAEDTVIPVDRDGLFQLNTELNADAAGEVGTFDGITIEGITFDFETDNTVLLGVDDEDDTVSGTEDADVVVKNLEISGNEFVDIGSSSTFGFIDLETAAQSGQLEGSSDGPIDNIIVQSASVNDNSLEFDTADGAIALDDIIADDDNQEIDVVEIEANDFDNADVAIAVSEIGDAGDEGLEVNVNNNDFDVTDDAVDISAVTLPGDETTDINMLNNDIDETGSDGITVDGVVSDEDIAVDVSGNTVIADGSGADGLHVNAGENAVVTIASNTIEGFTDTAGTAINAADLDSLDHPF